MGRPGTPEKVKLIVGLISADTELFCRIANPLERYFGKIDYESHPLDFTHTDYYKDELGSPLIRKFLSFETLRDCRGLYKTKVRTNLIERAFARGGRRTINIDPGYIDAGKMVLFSTKDYSHRIYVNKGIFAEVTLYYKDKTFQPWPWTYPDYRAAEYIKILNGIRDRYKMAMKGVGGRRW